MSDQATNKKSTAAVLYARVSGDDTKQEGRNLQGQLEMCRNYASQKGYHVIAELAEDDRGASGASFDLPQLNRIREMAVNGQFDVLIVRELDRLSRNLAKQLVVEEELKRAGVKIEYVLGEYADTPEGRLSKHIRATIAEYEREKIRERMVRGRRLGTKNGKTLVAGHPPYGYRVKEGTFVIHEPEARVVKLIFLLYVSDKLSPREIAKELNKIAAPLPVESAITPNRVGWLRTTVLRILKNETYTGTWHYGKKNGRTNKMNPREQWIPVDVPQIIDLDTFQEAKRLVEENKRKAPVRKHDYLLSGRIRCARCNQSLVGSGSGKKYYYRSSRQKASVYHKCEMPHFPANLVDAVVWGWVESRLLDPQQLEHGLSQYKQIQEVKSQLVRTRLSIVEDLLSENKTKLSRLLDAYLNGDFPRDMLDEQKHRIESAIETLAVEKSNLEADLHYKELSDEAISNIKQFAAQIANGFEIADFKTRLRIVELLDVQAIVDVEDGEKIIWLQCRLNTHEPQGKRLKPQTRNDWRGG